MRIRFFQTLFLTSLLALTVGCSKDTVDVGGAAKEAETKAPGGGTSSFSYGGTSSTGYSQSSGTNSVSDQTYSSTGSDENVVQVSGGSFTMTDCTVTKTGDTATSGDETSFYGVNSSVFAGNEDTSSSAIVTMTGGTITSTAQGANGIFAYGGGVINVSDVTIYNNSRASRGLIATGGGTIIGSNLDITTCDETSSVIATDRGGGTVTVSGSSLVCKGNKCAIIYSAGTMTTTDCTGSSALGEIADIEGDNSVTITGCTYSCSGSSRGLLMMNSGSGDADGYNPVMTITNSTLTMTDSSAPLLEVATAVTATCTLDNVTLTVPSGILMAVMEDDQWDYSGAVGNLILANGEYTGQVYADDGYTANVTVQSTAVWNLTADTTIDALVNEGTIVTNGYSLTYDSLTGDGSIVSAPTTTSYGCVQMSAAGDVVTLSIDGDSEYDCQLTTSVDAASISYTRTFYAGVASTICLPFDIYSVSGATMYQFDDVAFDSVSGEWEVSMTEVTSGSANTPYLLITDADSEVTLAGSGTFDPSASLAFTSGDWTFTGTYFTKEWSSSSNADEIGSVYGFAASSSDDYDAGQFVKVASGAGIRPFRAYLYYNGSTVSSAPARMRVQLKRQ